MGVLKTGGQALERGLRSLGRGVANTRRIWGPAIAGALIGLAVAGPLVAAAGLVIGLAVGAGLQKRARAARKAEQARVAAESKEAAPDNSTQAAGQNRAGPAAGQGMTISVTLTNGQSQGQGQGQDQSQSRTPANPVTAITIQLNPTQSTPSPAQDRPESRPASPGNSGSTRSVSPPPAARGRR